MKTIPYNITIKELLDLKKNNLLRVNPEYQRGAVWNDTQQKKLIDSVLRGYPLPLIYLHHKKVEVAGIVSESFEIIDGQQRTNALYRFFEGGLKLFNPINDDKTARFPKFIKEKDCPWSGKEFHTLSNALQNEFLDTRIAIVKVYTENDDEARDLFIRLQAGLPLNAQEKRDAWPGGYTEFVLKFGGKNEIFRYPGHDFFTKVCKNPTTDRGSLRQLCAQIGMLFFNQSQKGNWLDIGTQSLDDYYYKNLDFNINSETVKRFDKILDILYDLFDGYRGKKLDGHEAIHLVLFVDSLLDDYTNQWKDNLIDSFDKFRQQNALYRKEKNGEYWHNYSLYTRSLSDKADRIALRHSFFEKEMIQFMNPILKDSIRAYGEIDKEILFYKFDKKCLVCNKEIDWSDLEIHHVTEHSQGGKTVVENGAPVHKNCHPKNREQVEGFKLLYFERLEQNNQLHIPVIQRRQTPSVKEWIEKVEELKFVENLNSWADICRYLDISINGDSARRKLSEYVRDHRNDWPLVPKTE